jgi:hypothetical protein
MPIAEAFRNFPENTRHKTHFRIPRRRTHS